MLQGETLKVKRPHDYNAAAAALLGPDTPNPNLNLSILGVVGSVVPEGPNRVFVGGLPPHFTQQEVRAA